MSTPTCNQTDCPVAATGACLEGLEPEDCPHYVPPTAEAPEGQPLASEPASGEPAVAEPVAEDPWVPKHSGDLVPFSGIGKLPCMDFGRLVMLVGPPDSGKTTVITSLHDEIQRGGLGWSFRHSWTLIGIERLSFLNRRESQRTRPDTPRTPRTKEAEFAHFRLVPADQSDGVRELFIMNLSGEHCEDLRHRDDAASEMPFLGRVDHVALLIDGEQLASSSTRWDAELSAMQLLDRLMASELSERAELVILISKFDELEVKADADDLIQTADEIAQRLTEKAGQRFRSTRTMQLAARPEHGPHTTPLNLAELADGWLEMGLPLGGEAK